MTQNVHAGKSAKNRKFLSSNGLAVAPVFLRDWRQLVLSLLLLGGLGLMDKKPKEIAPMSGQWLHMMDAQGLTPLDRAFNSGHMALAELMLRQERLDSSEALKGSTPLHRAAALGLNEAVQSQIGRAHV